MLELNALLVAGVPVVMFVLGWFVGRSVMKNEQGEVL